MNMGIVVPTGHPLASRSAVRFSQCLDYPFILPSAPLMISEPVEALVNISGNEVKEVAVSNNIHMIRTLIKEQMASASCVGWIFSMRSSPASWRLCR